MSTLPGGDSPSRVNPVELVAVPKDGTALTVRFVGPVTGLHTHWDGKHSVYCSGPQTCPSQLHRSAVVWKGYACVEYHRAEPHCDWVPGVLEVTERLDEILDHEHLRAQVWKLFRPLDARKRKEISGHLIETHNADTLRKPFPILPVLARIYRRVDLALGVARVMPARIFLEPTPGEAPSNVIPLPHVETVESQPKNSEAWRKMRRSPSTNGKHHKS